MITTGRREANKARTRRAMVDAARALGQERGLENVTAEEIADRAGVSRRTFFNYFCGIEDVVAADLAEPLQHLAEALQARPAQEDPLTAIAGALREHPIGPEVLLAWRPAGPRASAQHQVLHLRIWQHHEQWLVDVLRRRLGTGDDDLRVRSLAGAVMALFEVVQADWLPRSTELDAEAAVAAFNDALLRALDHARSGWR